MTPLREFEQYTLLGEIAEGGMGVVYQAVHRGLNRSCALKLIRAGLLATPDERRRFVTEAEAAAKLDHANIVRVGRAGESEGQWFLEMELVEGGTLADRIAEGPLPPKEAAILVERLAGAVQHAHERGVLHRDLKPGNVLLAPDGQPKLTDFGLARFLEKDSDLTRTVAVLGTPAYLAPELASGRARKATIKADVYSLGVVLFECLTGQRPFQGQTPLEILRAVQDNATPRPTALRPDVPCDLETICLKCLEKEPARRYATVRSLADDLQHWLHHEPISARPPTLWERGLHWARRRPTLAALTVLAVLTLLLTATFALASYRTYFWLMATIADEHLIVPPDADGVFRLKLSEEAGPRCSNNFWKLPFGSYYTNLTRDGRYARFEFSGIESEVAAGLQVQIWSDVPVYTDIVRTSLLTNGAIFYLDMGQRRERAYYFGEGNFAASNIVACFPDAALHVVLLGCPGDPDPYRIAGKLKPRERQ